jgi:glycosyltransferase involved in cell wall biosynthesis
MGQRRKLRTGRNRLRYLILAEDEENFAQAIIDPIKEASLRKSFGEITREVVETNYYWRKNLSKSDNILKV